MQRNPNISNSGTATSAPASPATPVKKRPPLAQAARTFLKGVIVPSSVTHNGKEYFITEDEQESVVFLMTAMTLFAYGLGNAAPEMKVNVSRSQLAEIIHRSIKTIGRRIALAKVLGLLKSESKGNHGEYIAYQKQGHYVVPVEEVSRWAKSRKSGPPELRNDTSPATTPSTEDMQLRNSQGGHPTETPTVPVGESLFTDAQQGHADDRTGTQENRTGTRERDNRDNVVSHTGVNTHWVEEPTGVVPTGASPATPASLATEVGSSVKTGEWSDPLRATPTAPADSSGKSGLVIQATKKTDLPECQICQQLAGHLSAAIIPDPKGKFCERHDNENYR